MLVRKAQPEDLDAIYRIASENAMANLKPSRLKNSGFLVSNYAREQYEQYIINNELFFLLEEHGEVQGFLLAFHDHELDFDQIVNKRIQKHAKNNYIVLKQICIRRLSHKKGYGRRLYEYLMSMVEKDIFLAVVLEPYNEASIRFHDKLGFKQVFTVQGEDQLKRGIFFWNNPHIAPHYDKEIILGQYEHAIELYKHEDSLNWSKINHLLYITGALVGLTSLLANILEADSQWFIYSILAVSLFGALSAFLFQVAISNGVEYMQRRKQAVVEVERILKHLGGIDIVSSYATPADKRFRRSPTTGVMKLIPKLIVGIWIIVLAIALYNVSA